jgi:N-methylhydantoinase B
MRGDRVIVKTAGGAGYGEPATRDPARVVTDQADGLITD